MKFSIEKYHFKTENIIENLPGELAFLKANTVVKEYKKGKLLFQEGSYPKGVFFLRKGKVKIYQTNKDGREQIVYIYTQGDMMGYRPILCDESHPVSAAALENCTVSFIATRFFVKALSKSPVLASKILINLSHEFNVWINRISVFAYQPAKERLALSLLILNEKYKRENKDPLTTAITLSRVDIANFIGAAEETIVRLLQNFKKNKIIKTEGRKIIILKPKELIEIMELC